MLKKTLIWLGEYVIGIMAILIALLAFGYIGGIIPKQENVGSIPQGQEYYSTSTVHWAASTTRKIKGGYGSLAQITITGAGTSAFTLYDATSTTFSHSNGKVSTSSALLAIVPASLAAGTYTFDVTFNRGLMIYYDTTGTYVTSTISYR